MRGHMCCFHQTESDPTRVGHQNFEGDFTASRFLLVSKFLLDFHDLTTISKNLLAMAPPA